MSSAITRQWELLRLVPTGPRRIDVATLQARLRERGFRIHRRTIQRDLVELASVFPLVSSDRSKPYGWRWADGAAPPFALPPDDGPEVVLRLRARSPAAHALAVSLRLPAVPRAAAPGTWQELTAVVRDSGALRRWLFAFGDAVEVLAPRSIREHLSGAFARAATLYSDPAGPPSVDGVTSSRADLSRSPLRAAEPGGCQAGAAGGAREPCVPRPSLARAARAS